jgi:hypothetical protein
LSAYINAAWRGAENHSRCGLVVMSDERAEELDKPDLLTVVMEGLIPLHRRRRR